MLDVLCVLGVLELVVYALSSRCISNNVFTKGGVMNDIKQEVFDKDKLDFAIFCIENVANKLNQNPRDTYDALTKKSNILMSYIVPSYDVLHTQGKEYITNDIISFMREKGVASFRGVMDFEGESYFVAKEVC